MKQLPGKLIILSAIVGGLLLFSCKNESGNKKSASVSVDVIRYEQSLFSMDIYSIPDSASQLSSVYPDFTALFVNKIIEIGDTVQPAFGKKLSIFLTNQGIFNLNTRVSEVFSDFSVEQDLLNKAFSNYKKYFPEKEVPKVYTYVSGLNQSIVTANGILGISLDKYLGEKEELYNTVYPPIPNYLRYTMQREYIVPEAVSAWIVTEGNPELKKVNFLSRVLAEARAVYVTKQLLPEISDTLLWGFTPKKLMFCKTNERLIWEYLIENKILFSTDNFRISQFVNPGPFTKDFSTDSPARAAVWLGYQIIESYMDRNKDVSLSELLAVNDFQLLLNDSRYNP